MRESLGWWLIHLFTLENEILKAVKYTLKRGKTIRVVRQITDSWSLNELERYEEVAKAGSQVR